MMEKDQGGPGDLVAEVNIHVRELADRLDFTSGDEDWGFICECSDPDCQQRVELTLAEYDALRRRGEPLLAAGHALTRPEQARRAAAELRAQSLAVRAQAETQLQRARTNLPTAAEPSRDPQHG
jgi:hypothetical protein